MEGTPLLQLDPVLDYVMDTDFDTRFHGLCEQHGLPVERQQEFVDLMQAVLKKDIGLADLAPLIAEAFAVATEKAEKVAIDFVGMALWPLRDFASEFGDFITKAGVPTDKYPTDRVGKEEKTEVEVAEEIMERSGLTGTDFFVKRLGFLTRKFADGEKTEEGFVTFLGRPLNVGGLQLSKEAIDGVLSEVKKILVSYTVVSEKKVKEKPAVKAVEEARDEGMDDGDQTGAAPVPRKTPLFSAAKAAEETVPAEAVQRAKESRGLRGAAERAYEEALRGFLEETAGVLEAHKEQMQQVVDVIGKGIRGVREFHATRDALVKAASFTPEELQKVMAALGRAMERYAEGGGDEGEEEAVAQPVADVVEEKETVAMDRKYAELVGADKVRPKPAKVEFTVGSVAPGSRGTLTDVVPTGKLQSPIEQLSSMSVVEFRRLNANPAQAVEAIGRMFDDLERVDIEERVRGMKAWRGNPLNALLSQMTSQALSGSVPVETVAAKRRAAGEATLTPTELKILGAFNARLRY